MSHSHFDIKSHQAKITLLGIPVQIDSIMPYRANFFFCYKPSSCILLLARQITAALFHPSCTPLGLRNVTPRCSGIMSDRDIAQAAAVRDAV